MRGELSRAESPPRPVIALAILAVSIGLGRLDVGPGLQALASLGTLLGAVLLVPVILRPLAAALGGVTRRLAPGVGDIAVLHLRKERSRSAYTLALVMVVLATVLSVAATNQAMARSVDEVVTSQFGGDLQLFAPGTVAPGVADQLRAIDGVAAVTALRFGRTEILRPGHAGRVLDLLAIDPVTYFDVQGFAFRHGNAATAMAALTEGGVVMVPSGIATDIGVGLGDSVRMRTAAGERDFRVVGIHAGLGDPTLVVGLADGDAVFGGGSPNAFVVKVTAGADANAVASEIGDSVMRDHAFELRTAQDSKEFARGQLRGFFGIAYAILLVTAVIGMLGLANTLIVSVLQRTREIGILRSAGSRRGQVRGMVLVEAATLVLVAYVLALPLADVIGEVAVKGFGGGLGIEVVFAFPWVLVPLVAVLAAAVGFLASVGPARRAARLDVVAALRFD